LYQQFIKFKRDKIKKIISFDPSDIYVETDPKDYVFICSGSKTHRIHDYRNQTIKDLPNQFKNVNIIFINERIYALVVRNFNIMSFYLNTIE